MIADLQKLAKNNGLAAIGIAPAIPEVLVQFSWAKSIISAAICYLPPESEPDDTTARGFVARVARSSDYHNVLREKLQIIADAIIITHPNAQTKVCVDTTPIPERKIAVLAGIASRGKNGNVFVKDCGSFAALGEIVTDIAFDDHLAAVEGFADCGSCSICIESCPTRAIASPGVVDRSRCVSQLTQMSGIIPRDMRKTMANNIYGCDACQINCPRNKGVQPKSPEFAVDIFPGASPELIPLLNLSSNSDNMLRESSIGWIRRTRIRRNAAIAAGNLTCVDAVEALVSMLNDPSPIIRAHAAWALGEIGTDTAMAELKKAAESEADSVVSEEIFTALANK